MKQSSIDRAERFSQHAVSVGCEAKNLDLLAHLYSHIGVTFTRPELLAAVWNCCPNLLTRTVDQTVATLRRKIEIDPQHPRFLRTLYGVGYSLSVNKGTK